MAEGGKGIFLGSFFIKAVIHSWEPHPHDLIISQRPHLMQSQWGLGFSVCLLGGDTNIQSIAECLGGLNNRDLFSHDSGDWKLAIRMLAWLSSGKSFLPALQAAVFSLCAHVAFPQ